MDTICYQTSDVKRLSTATYSCRIRFGSGLESDSSYDDATQRIAPTLGHACALQSSSFGRGTDRACQMIATSLATLGFPHGPQQEFGAP